MTETMANLELNTFMGKEVPEHETPTHNKSLIAGGILILVLLVACYWVSDRLIDTKKNELLAELQTRQEITISGKADVIQTWVDQTGTRANLLTRNPLIQLFATEMNQLEGQDLSSALSAQLPYMQNAITRFVQENNLIAAYMVGKNGRAYLASAGSPGLTDDQRQTATAHYSQTDVGTTRLRVHNGAVIFDFLVPVLSAQTTDDKANRTVGVFVMTVTASDQLAQFLKGSRLTLAGEKTLLFQKTEQGLLEITPTAEPLIAPSDAAISAENILPFGSRELPGQSESVFSAGAEIENTALVLLQTVPQDTGLAQLRTYSYVIYGLAASAFVVIVSIVAGIWLGLRSQNAKDMAGQYKDLAQQINAQRRLLGNINNTVHDLISLKDPSGRYVYANPSLARFVNFPEKSISGKTDRDLFGDKIARKFAELDEDVAQSGQKTNEIVEMNLQGVEKFLRVEKTQLLDDDGDFMGIVTVCGDITDYITHQRQKDELGRKTISILVRMMEENDPHLAGHSHFMGELAGNVSELMQLPRDVKQTLLAGANLSQIGKISIPSEIRTKEGRLTKKEMDIMQGHVGKAENLLSEMEIDQTIVTAICQMYERQDGSGYPNHLEGAAIDLSARILGMADILVARVSPRTYRQAISVEEAMEVFRTNSDKYDPAVTEAFDAFLENPAGSEFKEKIELAAKD